MKNSLRDSGLPAVVNVKSLHLMPLIRSNGTNNTRRYKLFINSWERYYKWSAYRCNMTSPGVGGELRKLGVRPSKNLGQNFLTDASVADWMVARAGILSSDRVLEIGPGLGILTERLSAAGGRLTAIELDRRFAADLRKRGIDVIQGDAMEVELPEFDVVVSNLPYQISSGITMRLLDAGFRKALLMFQKEFAEHLVAPPGERKYSRISVMVAYRAKSEIVRSVPRGCFHPVPKVDSAIVEMVPRKPDFEIADESLYKETVRILFSHKNRKVRNGISAEHAALGLSKESAKGLAEELPFKNERPITLTPAQLAEVANAIKAAGLSGLRNSSQ
jgi:16S rRNA (adenine1518-N6/adenine1519-N6)-dimethyltransferase